MWNNSQTVSKPLVGFFTKRTRVSSSSTRRSTVSRSLSLLSSSSSWKKRMGHYDDPAKIGTIMIMNNHTNATKWMMIPPQQVAALHVVSRAARTTTSTQRQQQQRHPTMTIRCFESEAAYHRVADATLESLQDAVEQELEDLVCCTPDDDMDISLASGVLTIALPSHGTWVLNKQTPNQQIWWSSPLSGPKRFEYNPDGNLWFATQNGLSLVPLLAQELSHVLKTEICLDDG